MMGCEELIADGLSARGSVLLSCEELERCLPYFYERKLYVQAVEAFEITEKYDTLNLAFSLLGLDREYDWDLHHSVPKMFALVRSKIVAAGKSAEIIKFKIWLDDWPLDTPERSA